METKEMRCNKGHLLEWDSDRKVWDCPICIKMMQEIANKKEFVRRGKLKWNK